MYKKIPIQLLFIILTVSLFCLMNCDGRKTKHQALRESIASFKKNNTITKATYFPQDYTETVNDTLLSNGFNIRIKYYTNMTTSVLKTKVKDTVTHQSFYRDFDAEISIAFQKQIILNHRFDKSFFVNEGIATNKELEDLRLQNMWIDEFATSNHTQIHFLYAEVNKKHSDHTHFKLMVDKTGHYTIQKVEPNNFTI